MQQPPSTDSFYFDSNVLLPDNLASGYTDDDIDFLVSISHHKCFNPGDTISFINGVEGIIVRTFGVVGSAPYYAAIKQTAGAAPKEGDILDTGENSVSGGDNPFDIINIDTTNSQITFVPGTGNNLVPNNMLQAVSFTGGSTLYAYLRLFTDGNSVQSGTLIVDGNAPASPAPLKNSRPYQVDVLIHLLSYTPPVAPATVGTYNAYRVGPARNISISSQLVFQTPAPSPNPGDTPYDNWYTWAIGP